MLKIFSVGEASRGILQRQPWAAFGMGSADGDDESETPARAVARILADVRQRGDVALREWTRKLDHVTLTDLWVKPEAVVAAKAAVSPKLVDLLGRSAERIRRFHEAQASRQGSWRSTELGGHLGQTMTPVDRAGVYVPGGSAPLISSVLMSVIPAQVAGVRDVVVATPPVVHPAILVAADLCGVDQVLQLGGAQAIAALALGSDTITPVDKIVGAGNLYVTLAKRQVFGVVGIDGLAGPTETMVIADDSAHPTWVAADLLAQAEHDALASAILLTPSRALAEAVQKAVATAVETLSRRTVIEQSLANHGGVVLVNDLAQAMDLANRYAPEHLCLAVTDAPAWAEKVRHAGGVFVGESSCEVLGDYVAGPSHVMPTGGTARFASPLNVLDFVKWTSWIGLDAQTSREWASVAAELARTETLTAHAAAAACREA